MQGAIRNPHHLERPLKVTLSCTQTCNLDCKHCYADCDAARAGEEMRGDEWRALADSFIEDGVISLFIEGGEPFRRVDDLLALVRHCGRRMMTRIRTNGTLVTPELARELKAAGLGDMLLDVLARRSAEVRHVTLLVDVGGITTAHAAMMGFLRMVGRAGSCVLWEPATLTLRVRM